MSLMLCVTFVVTKDREDTLENPSYNNDAMYFPDAAHVLVCGTRDTAGLWCHCCLGSLVLVRGGLSWGPVNDISTRVNELRIHYPFLNHFYYL